MMAQKHMNLSANTEPTNDGANTPQETVAAWDNYEHARQRFIELALDMADLELDIDDANALCAEIDVSGKMPIAALANIFFNRYGDEVIGADYETQPEFYSALTFFQAVYLEGKKLARQEQVLFEAENAVEPIDDPAKNCP